MSHITYGKITFGFCRWSADTRALAPNETYLACPEANGYVACPKPGGNGINIYETKNFALLDKKHVIIEGLRTFRWSPTRPILAYYCDERVSVYFLPFRAYNNSTLIYCF